MLNHDYATKLKNLVVMEKNQDRIIIPKDGQKTDLERYYKIIDKLATKQNVNIFRNISNF